MIALLNFIYLIVNGLLSVMFWVVVINAIVSWLIVLQIVNMRNRIVYDGVRILDRVTTPLLWPLRRLIPPLGGLDVTPVIFCLAISAAQTALLPAFFNWLGGLVG